MFEMKNTEGVFFFNERCDNLLITVLKDSTLFAQYSLNLAFAFVLPNFTSKRDEKL